MAGDLAGLPPEAALAAIAQRESGNRNIPNAMGPGGTPISTASGPYQIINPTWRAEAPAAGVDVNQYPTAMSAPPQLQHAVALAMFQKYGAKPWAASAPGAKGLGSMVASAPPPAAPPPVPTPVAPPAAAPGPAGPNPAMMMAAMQQGQDQGNLSSLFAQATQPMQQYNQAMFADPNAANA